MKLLLTTFLFFSIIHTQAAETNIGAWLGTFSQKKLTDTFSYWLETQVRYNLNLGNTAQVLYRTGVLHKIKEDQSLGYLYAYIQSGNNREHRFTLQDVQKYSSLWNLHFSHRARLEFRNLEETSQTFESGWRFRYLLRADQNKTSGLSLVVWDEVFLNLNNTDWNGNNFKDRNRLFIGIKHKVLESNRIELGYLNQYVPRKANDIMEHIATIYLFF